MKNAISTLRIQNFKSIKDVTMTPRRVNIIIGEPNVGKSNILEAMSLLGGMNEQTGTFNGSVLRYENLRQLFYDNLTDAPILVETEHDKAIITDQFNFNIESSFQYFLIPCEDYNDLLNSEIFAHYGGMWTAPIETRAVNFFPTWRKEQIKQGKAENPPYMAVHLLVDGERNNSENPSAHGASGYGFTRSVKYYSFLKTKNYTSNIPKVLHPPHGDNLLQVVQSHSNLRKEIAHLFKHYGLKFLLRVDERRLEVVKDLDGIIYSYPYSSTADTLQRLIFYLAAIESNDDAVLLFEEPEAHSYPIYILQLARRIVESRNNQFFVVTHSPYLITEVLEEMLTNDELAPELAMFVAYYEDYQTKVRQLSDEEMRNIRRDGLDVFYNMARFVPER